MDFLVMSLTLLASTILAPSLNQNSSKLGLMFGCGVCVCFCQLLDYSSLMIIWVVTNLISGDDQFKLRIHYCCESQLGISLKICGSFPCIRFLPDSEMLPLTIISFSLLCLHPPHPNISSSLSHCPQSIQENSSIFLPEKIYVSLLRQQGSFL